MDPAGYTSGKFPGFSYFTNSKDGNETEYHPRFSI
jgi:hypothetical protein